MAKSNKNLELFNRVRAVPKEAQKEIKAGRLKGFTDINPLWRIEILTGEFGICGIGWKTENEEYWIEDGAEGEKAAFCRLDLFIKQDDVWSAPIKGIGGSMLVAKESKGLRTNDEAFKMAKTDAISVACKDLGIGADIYWEQGRTKYESEKAEEVASIIKMIGEVAKSLADAGIEKTEIAKIVQDNFVVDGKSSANYNAIKDIEIAKLVLSKLKGKLSDIENPSAE